MLATEPEMHEWLNCMLKNKLLGDCDVEKTVEGEGENVRASFRVNQPVFVHRRSLRSLSFSQLEATKSKDNM